MVDNRYIFWTHKCTVWRAVWTPDISYTSRMNYVKDATLMDIPCHLSKTKSPASSSEKVSSTTQLVRLFVLFPNDFVPDAGTIITVDGEFYSCSGYPAIYPHHMEVNLIRGELEVDTIINRNASK